MTAANLGISPILSVRLITERVSGICLRRFRPCPRSPRRRYSRLKTFNFLREARENCADAYFFTDLPVSSGEHVGLDGDDARQGLLVVRWGSRLHSASSSGMRLRPLLCCAASGALLVGNEILRVKGDGAIAEPETNFFPTSHQRQIWLIACKCRCHSTAHVCQAHWKKKRPLRLSTQCRLPWEIHANCKCGITQIHRHCQMQIWSCGQ